MTGDRRGWLGMAWVGYGSRAAVEPWSVEHGRFITTTRLGAAVIALHKPDIVNVCYLPLLLETHPDADGNVGGQAAVEPRLFRTEELWATFNRFKSRR